MTREMKDSGIEWIGEIPASWKTNTVFQLFTQVKNKNSDLQEQNLLSLSYGKIKRKSIDTTDGLLPESFDGYNIIEADDIVLRLTDLQNDHKSLRVGLATERGIVTSAYLTIRNRSESIAKYLYYYLHSFDIAKGFYGMGAGVRQGLNWDEMKWLKILTPSVLEQQHIASFLDTECARIDAVIEKTRASIEEYKKLKQAIITQAVTKGIRPNRQMKDSGIEWIGEIPEDWSVVSVGRLFTISAGGDAKPEFYSTIQDEGHPYPVFTNSMNKNQVYAYTSNPVFPKDTITVTGRGAIGTAFYREVPYDAIIRLLSLKPKLDLDGRFYAYWISNVIHFFTDSAAIGQLSSIQMASYKTVYCSKEEQGHIANYLDSKVKEIESLIEKKEKMIFDIESYKKSLIFEYVTGNKEVPA